jgi:hypothetical protein
MAATYNERSQQQKSNDNSENFLVNCVFIFAHDNNCLYWIENKLFLFLLLFTYSAAYNRSLYLCVYVHVNNTTNSFSFDRVRFTKIHR